MTATRFATIWVDRSLSPPAWLAALRPLLTSAMAHDTADIDPTDIPATTVTGPATMVTGPPARTGTTSPIVVKVPTDVGGMLVRLDRTGRRVTSVKFDTAGN